MGERILIVEDEPDILDLISYNLQQAGYAVLLAEDGERGLQLATKEIVSLVVLDLMMPGIDGSEATRALRERWPRLPVVISSGYTGRDDISELQETS